MIGFESRAPELPTDASPINLGWEEACSSVYHEQLCAVLVSAAGQNCNG